MKYPKGISCSCYFFQSMFQKPVQSAAPEAHRGAEPQDAVETVVGPSVVVEGDFSSEGSIVVKGTVSGSVQTSKMLTVEEGAKIFANIRAGNAMVAGIIRGNAKVAERLELLGSARIAGDVECKVLVVEAGALVNGKVAMGGMDGEDMKLDRKSSGFGRLKAKAAEKDSVTEGALS